MISFYIMRPAFHGIHAEYATYLGMRMAEKCDFDESHKYYQVSIA